MDAAMSASPVKYSLLLFLLYVVSVKCQSDYPPEISGSYTVVGEIVQSKEVPQLDGELRYQQLTFQESYDKENNMSAFQVWEAGSMTTFWEDLNTKQTFIHQKSRCTEYLPEDWQKAHIPPDINILEIQEGTILFPIRQLLALPNKQIVKSGFKRKFRDIDAVGWSYDLNYTKRDEIFRLKIDELWSEKAWKTSSPNAQVPLGFIVTKAKIKELHHSEIDQYFTVTHFVKGTPDEKLMQPPPGVFCTGRKTTRLSFPRYNNMKYFSYNYEVVIPEYGSMRSGQTWFNVPEKIIRTDYWPLNHFGDDETFVSRICTLRAGGIVYEIGAAEDKECEVGTLATVTYDPQLIIDTSVAAHWNVESFFGVNDNQYFYLGETSKRGIPCSRWQAYRKDWPSMERNVESVWEWCIADTRASTVRVYYDEDTFPVIALDITVNKSSENEAWYYEGLQLKYHFYNFKNYSTPLINAVAFDITPCSKKEEMLHVKFQVEVPGELKSNMGLFISDVIFLESWKLKIYDHLGEPFIPASLRLQRFKAFVDKSKELWVMFTILDPLKSVKDAPAQDKTKEFIQERITAIVNAETLSIKWKSRSDKKEYTFTAKRNTFKPA